MEPEGDKLKEIENFVNKNYEVYQEEDQDNKENMTVCFLDEVINRLEQEDLQFSQKGRLLFLKSALNMIIDKNNPQIQKDLLKSVNYNFS